MSFFAELKRRNVFRAVIAYALIAWVVLQAVDFLTELINAPSWVLQIFFIAAAIGLLAVLILSWVFEMTPEGIKRESQVNRDSSITPQTGRKLDRIIIVFLAVTVGLLVFDRFVQSPGEIAGPITTSAPLDTPDMVVVPTDDRSLAVLPFVAMSSGEDDEYFADGLTEEILNSLAQLPELLVTARTSAFSFKGKDEPVAQIAEALGVRHIVEGSVRRSGERIRVTAQLIRAEDGFHLWSDTYDATSADTISVQEDIAEKIAVALNVVLDDSKRQAMQLSGLRNVEAFTLYQKARYHYQLAHGEAEQIPNLREANRLIEQVLELVPSYAPAYVEHSDLYAHYLLNDISGVVDENVSPEDVAGARANALRDYDLAIEHARNDRERHSFEYDRAFLAGDWAGITGRAQRVISDGGCTTNNWMAPFTALFGLAEEFLAYAENYRRCDPLVSIEWFNETRALLWAGQPEAALLVAEEGSEVAPGGWLNILHMQSLLALERYEDAERVAMTRMQWDGDVQMARMYTAAARGDRETLDRVYTDFMANEEYRSDLFKLSYYAWTGQREFANEFAAELEARNAGPYEFSIFIIWCACGAPFDLDAAPNFARVIEDSGLAWPPASPIAFPLKDW